MCIINLYSVKFYFNKNIIIFSKIFSRVFSQNIINSNSNKNFINKVQNTSYTSMNNSKEQL